MSISAVVGAAARLPSVLMLSGLRRVPGKGLQSIARHRQWKLFLACGCIDSILARRVERLGWQKSMFSLKVAYHCTYVRST